MTPEWINSFQAEARASNIAVKVISIHYYVHVINYGRSLCYINSSIHLLDNLHHNQN
jgi:hypothetical protein